MDLKVLSASLTQQGVFIWKLFMPVFIKAELRFTLEKRLI